MIVKFENLLHAYTHSRATKNVVEHVPLTAQEKIKADRIVTLFVVFILIVVGLLYSFI